MKRPENIATPARKSKLLPRVGEIQPFSLGRVVGLSPLPLPTAHQPQDLHKKIGAINDVYIVYGSSRATIYLWQMIIGMPLTMFVLSAMVFRAIFGLGTLFMGGTMEDAKDFTLGVHREALGDILPLCLFLFLGFTILLCTRRRDRGVVPPRFNRQRREVCFVPQGQSDAFIVPWESVTAWTTQAQGATQYGVQRQYGLGVGFHHEPSGEDHIIEYPFPALPLALCTWEAIRAYMEYEVTRKWARSSYSGGTCTMR